MNRCAVCGEDFASLSAFDDHRGGKHAYLYSEAHPDGRRCLTVYELRSLGMRKDSRGRWRLPIRGTQPWTSDVTAQNREQLTPGAIGQDGRATRQSRYITRKGNTSAADAKARPHASCRDLGTLHGEVHHQGDVPRG